MRFAILLYGVLAYLAFLGAFLYLIGFVGDLWVPRSVDRGPEAPPARAVAGNVALLLAFAVQHTVMARPWFKQRWTRWIPPAAERSTFVLIASGLLMLLYWQWRPLPGVVWEVEHPAVRAVLLALFASGWGIVLLSSFLIDHFDLFGLRQVWLNWIGRAYTAPDFKERSLYRVIRHPLMLGFLIAFWSAPVMTTGRLVLAGVFTGYILVAIRIEERDLLAMHGASYSEYRRRTTRLVPWPFRRG